LRPPCGGTLAIVPSMILSRACCTPSPNTFAGHEVCGLLGGCSRMTSARLRRVKCWLGYELMAASKAACPIVIIPVAATTHRMDVSLRSFHPDVSAFPERVVGSTCALSFSRLARRSLALRPAHSRCHQFVTR
jgi:hypothetical protein